MSQELHYTSVPRGLKPGTRGFCTVAMTSQIVGPLFERLENLSGYQPVYPPHDPAASRNPVNFAHVRFSLGGRPVSILSRVGPAGLDYTGRTNKYAHHVVLDAAERPDGGPAWLIGQPGFMQSAWDGDPRMLDEGRPVPQGDRPGGTAAAWATLTGDAGWAGVLAEAFLTDPKRPAFLVFRPGMELLPLFTEAIALLPSSRRWEVEFSTYLTQAPRGINYAWRGVLEGSSEAENARRLPNALVIDLCGSPRSAEGGPLVHTARTGEHHEWTGMPAPAAPGAPVREIATPGSRPAPLDGAPPREAIAAPPGKYDLIPELAARLETGKGPSHDGASPSRARRRRTGVLVGWLVTACVVLVIATAFLIRDEVKQLFGLSPVVQLGLAESRKLADEKRDEIQKADSERPVKVVATGDSGPRSESGIKQRNLSPADQAYAKAQTLRLVGFVRRLIATVAEVRARVRVVAEGNADSRLSATIKPLFRRLEEPPEEFDAGTKLQRISLGDDTFQIQSMELLGGEGLAGTPRDEGSNPRLVVSSRGSTKDSDLGSSSDDVAIFRASRPGEIEFRWTARDLDRRDRLRDSVLVLRSTHKKTQYCIFRGEPRSQRGISEFVARHDSEQPPHYTYFIYRWDEGSIYYNKLKEISISGCKLTNFEGKRPIKWTEDGGRWVASSPGGPVMSVELCQARFQPDGQGRQQLVLLTKDGPVPISRPSGNRSQGPADKWSAIVVKFFDNAPGSLRTRVEEKEGQIKAKEEEIQAAEVEKKDRRATEIRKEIRGLRDEQEQLVELDCAFKSLIDISIVWRLRGVELEIAHLDARKLIPAGGPQVEQKR